MRSRSCTDHGYESLASESLVNANSVESDLLDLKMSRPSIRGGTPTSVRQVAGSSRGGSPRSRSNLDKVEKPEAEAVGKYGSGKTGAVKVDFAWVPSNKTDEFSISEKPMFEVDFNLSPGLQKRIPVSGPVQAASGPTKTGETADTPPIAIAQGASSGSTTEMGKAQSAKPAETQGASSGSTRLGKAQSAKPAETQGASSGATTELGEAQSAKPAVTQVASSGATTENGKAQSAKPAEMLGASSGATTELGEAQSAKPAETQGASSGATTELGEAQNGKPAKTQSVSSGATVEMEAPQTAKPAEMQGVSSESTTKLEVQLTAKPAEMQGATSESTRKLEVQLTAKPAEMQSASSGSTTGLGEVQSTKPTEAQSMNSGSSLETIELELHIGTRSKPVGTQGARSGPRQEPQIQQSANVGGSQGTSSGSTLETMELEVPQTATSAGTQSALPGGKQGISSESTKELEVPRSATPPGGTKTVSSGSTLKMPASANPDDKTTKEDQESETKDETSVDIGGRADDIEETPVQQEEESPCPQKQSSSAGQKVPVTSHNVKKPRENLVLGQLSVMDVEVLETAMALPLSSPVLGDILENQHRYRSLAVRCGCELVFSRRVVVKRTLKWIRYAILILRGPTDVALKRFRRLLEAANTQFKNAVPYDTEKPRARLLTSEQLPDNLELVVCAERTGRSVVDWEQLPLNMPKHGVPVVKKQNLILPNNEATRQVLTYLYPGWGFQESKPIPNNRVYDTSVDAAEALEKQQKMEL